MFATKRLPFLHTLLPFFVVLVGLFGCSSSQPPTRPIAVAPPRPEGRPHDELLGMRFGELVAIMAGDQPRAAIDQRQDRQLHGGVIADQPIEHTELGGMNDVLGVVKDDRGGARRACLLIAQQRAPQ